MKKNNRTLSISLALILGVSAFSTSASAQSFWKYFGFGNSSGSSSHSNVQPAFSNVGQNLIFLDRYSDEMLWRYGSEFRNNRNCPKHLAFFNHMKSYNRKVDTLVRASRGKCTKTFKKAACDARENLTCLQKARKGLNIGNRACYLIRQSCPYATFIHKNSSWWKPYAPVQQSTCGGNNNVYSYSNGRSGGRNRGYQNTRW